MRVPASTYRLQVTAELDLFAAADLLGYLHDLGVDWVYLSPILAAEPGSTHGYDVVDPHHVDPSRGGAEGLAAVSAEAKRLGMGVLVDIVPNHMGVATPAVNAAWWDLLTHGRDSAYAGWFDVDWTSGAADVRGKIVVPVVGEGDEGAIGVGADAVTYHEHRFPLAPGTSTLAEQHYALVDWRRGDAELNYRRFFTVSTLAGVRVEDRDVFDATHTEVRRWFDEGLVDGLRIDHPDGLRDPGGYLDDLAALSGSAYTLVEKILEPGEALETGWATAGTTGYDVLGTIDRVLVDPGGETALTRGSPDYAELVHERKLAVATTSLLAETRRIVRELALDQLPAAEVEQAVAEVLACFGVYRSYLPRGAEHLQAALDAARTRRPDLGATYDALWPALSDPEHPAALRLQQTSGMVMAKGVEDSTFYRYATLTSLNEVGGDPSEFSIDVAGFHEAMALRQRDRPHALTALTTHDTKRSEDVRARISVLAEIPDAWVRTLDRLLDLAPLPDRAFANLLWQAVLGVWGSDPDDALRRRLHAYAEKAMREAGDHTTWTDPDATYERSVHRAVDAAFDDRDARATIDELAERVAGPGWSNALAAKLVALTVPGVPDVYQGSELWEQSLVDPDNRRAVDYAERRDLLGAVRDGASVHLSHTLDDPGVTKLMLTHAALVARRDHADLFTSYDAITASGPAADHVLAFDRGGAITVVTRLPVGLGERGGWGDTVLEIEAGDYLDLVSTRSLALAARPTVRSILGDLPVALLVPA